MNPDYFGNGPTDEPKPIPLPEAMTYKRQHLAKMLSFRLNTPNPKTRKAEKQCEFEGCSQGYRTFYQNCDEAKTMASLERAFEDWKARRDGKVTTKVPLDDELRAHGLRVGNTFRLPQDDKLYEVIA